jgi:TonB family protein
MNVTRVGINRSPGRGGRTANDRFKSAFGAWLCGGMMVATAIHFALMRYFPPLTAADFSFGTTEFEAVDLPPEVQIPPPPETITRPAVPVVAHTVLEEDITIAPTTFEQNPVETLPPPPVEKSFRLEDQPTFTPYTVAPSLKDKERAAGIVRAKYPKILQDAGIGGTVVVWAFIDEKGVVRNCQIHTSCGNIALDDAAAAAVMEFTFRPALNYDKNVPVWVSIPITFAVLRAS